MKEKQKKKRKACYYRIGVMFALGLLLVPVGNLVCKDRTYSEQENRMLTEKPKWSFSGIADGSFMKSYENYCADQFAGRDFLVRLKTNADFLAGKREENGVYKGKDKYLLEQIKDGSQKDMKENTEAMKQFQKGCPDVRFYMLAVPNAAAVWEERLPSFAVEEDQKAKLSALKKQLGSGFAWLDAWEALAAKKDQELYYHTDHHWTTEGAKAVFDAQAENLGIPKEEQVAMELRSITEDFNGTLSAMSGYETGYRENIRIAVPKKEADAVEYVVTYPDEQKKTATLYDSGKLKEKDKYGVFLGGNFPEVDIHTNEEEKDRLLLVKDSYANCFVQFLLPYYREIVMVDPRYYSGSIKTLMQEHKITDVLFLYNMNTFVEDNNISGVLEEYGEEGSGKTE